jgi:hypothetical protein
MPNPANCSRHTQKRRADAFGNSPYRSKELSHKLRMTSRKVRGSFYNR